MESRTFSAWLATYRAELKASLRRAAADGYHAVRPTGRELDPREFSRSARRHLWRYLRDLGLHLDGIALDYPGRGLDDPALVSARLERLAETLLLCRELTGHSVAVTLGRIAEVKPADEMAALLTEVADRADRTGVTVLVEAPGQDPGPLAGAVRSIGCPFLRLGVDAVQWLRDATVLTRCSDVLGGVQARDVRQTDLGLEEVPFGQGEVDLGGFLGSLAAIEYEGSIVLRCGTGAGVDAPRQAREYMELLIRRGVGW